MSDATRVAIVGTGYVGLTTGACLAHLGAHVVCCDIDAAKIELLRAGTIPIVEEGLTSMVDAACSAGRLSFELGIEAVRDAEVVFLCVPTPQDEDGSADMQYVRVAAAQLGPLLQAGAVVVNKSTVPVGSAEVVAEALGRTDVHVVSNPEFLREGTAVYDFLHPDRVVIGATSDAAARKVASLYESLDTVLVVTDPRSAELIKYAANGFLAMKISFANAIASLCEDVGADVASVVDGMGSDRRIGRSFLNAGPGWGGSCFPKDSRALIATATAHGHDFAMMRTAIEANERQHERMVEKIARAAGRPPEARLEDVAIGVLGLTFKAGTDDLRESPSLEVVRRLLARGASVRAFDPTVLGPITEARRDMLRGIVLEPTALDACKDVDVVAVLTEWPEFFDIDLTKVADVMRGDAIVDTRNLLDPTAAHRAELRYDAVGRGRLQ